MADTAREANEFYKQVIAGMLNEQASRDRVESALGIESFMVGNTNQLRTLAGSARRWNLPYQLDFRISTLLDAGGLHTFLFDELSSADSDTVEADTTPAPGARLYVKCLVYCKLVGQSTDDPVGCFLSLRLRDYIWLQTMDGDMPRGMKMARFFLERDEWTPQPADPKVQGGITASRRRSIARRRMIERGTMIIDLPANTDPNRRFNLAADAPLQRAAFPSSARLPNPRRS